MEKNTEKKCSEVIGAHLKSRLADIFPVEDWREATAEECREVLEDIGASVPEDLDEMREEAEEKARDRACEMVLGVSQSQVYRVDLGCGGPADWLEFWFSEGELQKCVYHYQDWFDGAALGVDDDTAAQLVDLWAIGPAYE